ncbi:hypothetical protein CBR_g57883 [Chara braunii]|uniref:Reverse transcriptase/retrotransposon-derived protein RNase H-like domain-containing protein n=1 Tax=Chara braunii TaxID=69332 RepID=A0A388K887_CHABU|nr:hypothetical protein CBR_g57883 [Chara braunii]|eukprot:GBG66284.1 hypothetical protein CBR_g57883 [Chara braunii]
MNTKIALEKSEFFLSEISFLGYMVTRGGLRPDSRKVEAVREAPTPTSLTEVRAFLRLASYYQRFIKGFAAIARPLTNLLRKDQPLNWDAEVSGGEEEEEEEENEEETSGEDEEETSGEDGEETSEEDEDYSEHSEHSEHEVGVVSEEKEEEEEEREEVKEEAKGKRSLEQSVGADLPVSDDPIKDPEPPAKEDEHPHAETSGTVTRRRSRSPSPSPRPSV